MLCIEKDSFSRKFVILQHLIGEISFECASFLLVKSCFSFYVDVTLLL